MGLKYTNSTASGYDASPPPDDGSAVPSNEIKWSTIKSKLPDPLKTFIELINTKLLVHFDESVLNSGGPRTTVAADHKRTINITALATQSLGDAATLAVGYIVYIKNSHSADNTVDLATGADTLDGTVGGSFTLRPGYMVRCLVNQAADGFETDEFHAMVRKDVDQEMDEQLHFNSDYSETANVTASTGSITLDLDTGTYFHTPTLTGIPTFTFSNPAASGRVSTFTLELNNALNFLPVFPAAVEWPGGIVPTWTAGKDIVTFVTRDGGTTWPGFFGGPDFQ